MKEINKKSILIGYKLKRLRLNRGYTQGKIAEVLGVSAQHYGTLERGINSFSLDNILKLCDFYNVTVMSILGELRKSDRKRKKECEKLISQIEELGDEHKEVVTHMVKFYRQLEKKNEKEEEKRSPNNLAEQLEDENAPEKILIEKDNVENATPIDEDEEDKELAELIQNLENELRQKEIGGMNRVSKKGKNKKKTSSKKKKQNEKTSSEEEKQGENTNSGKKKKGKNANSEEEKQDENINSKKRKKASKQSDAESSVKENQENSLETTETIPNSKKTKNMKEKNGDSNKK